ARPLQLIANLFFEETEVCMEENEQSDLTIDIRLKEESGQAHAMAVLTAKPSDKEYTASYTKKLTADGDKERLKQMKMVASHVFLSVLQEYTSITQKWGILTGMRPTKLFHKHRQAGLTTEEVRQKL